MLTVILAVLALAAPAGSNGRDDDEGQWSCTVLIDGSRGSSVMVTLQQTVGGTVVSRSVGWSPPVLDQFAPRAPRPEAPELTVFYDMTEQGEIGPADMILGGATSLGGLATVLAGKTLSLDLDGRGPWTVAVPARGLGPDYPLGDDMVRHRSAFFDAPELPALLDRGGIITLSLLDAGGYLAAQTRYDLTYAGERAHLFVEARDRVAAMMRLAPDEAIARYPDDCSRATGTVPPEFLPPLTVSTP